MRAPAQASTERPGTGAPLQVAIVDGASFVLPYDHGLATGLARQGHRVTLFASATRYNADFLQALRDTQGVEVVAAAVSGTVAGRVSGVLAYARLWLTLWRRRARFSRINLQFSVLWPLELLPLWLLRRRLVFTVHNAVPHGFAGERHRPTQWIADLARHLVFVSDSTRLEFLRRYGQRHASRSTLLPHGTLPLSPGLPLVAYAPRQPPQALVFWSSVRPYKGVDLFADLARSPDWPTHGLPLEVQGAWSPELAPLRAELRGLGVTLVDEFLDTPALQVLLARNVVFVLPYREASQSGALFTLLHHGCTFICSDVGDLGDFMRRFGLQDLLLRDRSAASMLECLAHLRTNGAQVATRLAIAQRTSNWDLALALAGPVYGAVSATAEDSR